MGKNGIKNVQIHLVPGPEGRSVQDGVDELRAAFIGRRLQGLRLSSAQKLAVLDGVIEELSRH